LYVNGLPFAQGHLIVTDDGEWAFQCDTVGGRPVPAEPRRAPAAEILEAAPETTFDDAPEVVPADEADESDPAAPTEDDITAETSATPDTPTNEEGAAD
jgi:hypothetical protein